MTDHGAPTRGEVIPEKFWSRVDVREEHDCWIWKGADGTKGYGRFYVTSRQSFRAHRVAFTLERGEIPSDKVVDHICRVRKCCNPAHLRLMTNKENVLAGVGPSAVNARKTHCKRGHELSGKNLQQFPDGRRQCRKCKTDLNRESRRVRVAARKAAAIRNLGRGV